jgi:hypothetical protein
MGRSCHPPRPAHRRVATRRSAVLLTLTASVAGGAACDEGGIRAGEGTILLGAEAETTAAWTPTPESPITIALRIPATVRQGAEVPIEVRVHNGGKNPVSVGFGQRRAFDVLVTRARGPADSAAVWSLPKFYTPVRDVNTTEAVPPGRDTVFAVVWPGVDDAGRHVPPGDYRIRATVSAALVSTRQLWTEWVPFTIQK